MTDRIWIERAEDLLPALEALRACDSIGMDTEFLREKTFFPKLCVLQLSAPDGVWCIDALLVPLLREITPLLADPGKTKIVHAARQDLEAYYCTTQAIVNPVFDTQIAAAMIGMKPQVGYAELAQTILGVSIAKNQTRTDWSRRPLTQAQLAYAAEDVRHLHALAAHLSERLRALGREEWARQDCAALTQAELYEIRIERAGARLKGLSHLDPSAMSAAFAIAAWREGLARERDLPRGWIIDDAAVLQLAQTSPRQRAGASRGLLQIELLPAESESLAKALDDPAMRPDVGMSAEASHGAPTFFASPEAAPTPEQKKLITALGNAVDARAKTLGIAAEILAPRAEVKAIGLGRRDTPAMRGWRNEEIGERLRALLPR